MATIPMTLAETKRYLASLNPRTTRKFIVSTESCLDLNTESTYLNRLNKEWELSQFPCDLLTASVDLAIIEAKYELALIEAEQKAFLAKVSQC